MQKYFPQLDELALFLIFSIAVSFLFYFKTRNVLKSLHGILIVIAYIYSSLVSRYSEFGAHFLYFIPMYVLLALAITSIIKSLDSFRGAGKQNLFLLCHIGLFANLVYVWFVSTMAISHDWL